MSIVPSFDVNGWQPAPMPAMPSIPTPTFQDPLTAQKAGYVIPNYTGSRQAKINAIVQDLVQRFASGQDREGWEDLWHWVKSWARDRGQPSWDDWGKNQVSPLTVEFFRDIVEDYYGYDESFLVKYYGKGDPNAPDATAVRTWLSAEESIALRQAELANQYNIALMQSQYALQATREQIAGQLQIARENNATQWAIAQLNAATQRYIAEGEWGVQRQIAALGEMGRLTMFVGELGLRYDELGLKAQQERNRHHETMMALVTEVAKYDAQLASEPRNWVAYAAWLKNKGMVVNGLTLGAAAQAISDADIPQSYVTNNPFGQQLGGMIAGLMSMINNTYAQGAQAGSGGFPGGGPPIGGPGGGPPQLPPGGNFQSPPPTEASTNFDYGAFLQEISPQQEFSQQELQDAYNDVDASGGSTDVSGYYAGPTQNQLGMNVNPLGHKMKFETFLNQNPSQQQMQLGAASSVGRPDNDYIHEFQKAMPRGRARSTVEYG